MMLMYILITSLYLEYNKVAEAAAKVEAEVKALHDKIMEIGSTKIKAQQARLDKVTKEIDETTTASNKAKVAIKNAKRSVRYVRLLLWNGGGEGSLHKFIK